MSARLILLCLLFLVSWIMYLDRAAISTAKQAVATDLSLSDESMGLVFSAFANLFKRRIADPIGMKRWDWFDLWAADGVMLNGPSGIYGVGILTTAREMARLGYLFLNKGKWEGNAVDQREVGWMRRPAPKFPPPCHQALAAEFTDFSGGRRGSNLTGTVRGPLRHHAHTPLGGAAATGAS